MHGEIDFPTPQFSQGTGFRVALIGAFIALLVMVCLFAAGAFNRAPKRPDCPCACPACPCPQAPPLTTVN